MPKSDLPAGTKLVTTEAWATLPPEERRRRELGATRLREQYSSDPFYAKRGEQDGNEYWARFYDSRVKS